VKKSFAQLSAVALAVVGFGLTGNAHAAWTFTGVNGGAPDLSYTDTVSSQTVSLAISSYAAANAVQSLVGGTGTNQYNSSSMNSGFTANTKWFSTASNFTYYTGGGLGNSSDGSATPNHATDNAGINTEAVLMQFGASVTLKTITTGYVYGDSDFSVFRWTGAGSPTSSAMATTMTGLTAAGTASVGGWELVGNYDGTATAGSSTINASNVSSSWWLVSAYNYAFGSACANCSTTGGTVDQGNDFFKLLSVAASATAGTAQGSGVPEPTSLALVAVAGLGALASRRRKAQAAA
jgi:hypothetical protein